MWESIVRFRSSRWVLDRCRAATIPTCEPAFHRASCSVPAWTIFRVLGPSVRCDPGRLRQHKGHRARFVRRSKMLWKREISLGSSNLLYGDFRSEWFLRVSGRFYVHNFKCIAPKAIVKGVLKNNWIWGTDLWSISSIWGFKISSSLSWHEVSDIFSSSRLGLTKNGTIHYFKRFIQLLWRKKESTITTEFMLPCSTNVPRLVLKSNLILI